MRMSPQGSDTRTTEERLADLERLIGHVIERASHHAVGRKVLAFLGLS